jgi:quercetin dioxygenase-like cupin family protein
VQRFRLAELPGRSIDHFGSRFNLAQVMRSSHGCHVALARLPPSGVIGRHPAATGQLLIVIEGSGWVSGGDGDRQPIRMGEAVCWAAGEEHETGSEDGLTAIIVEGPEVRPPV